MHQNGQPLLFVLDTMPHLLQSFTSKLKCRQARSQSTDSGHQSGDCVGSSEVARIGGSVDGGEGIYLIRNQIYFTENTVYDTYELDPSTTATEDVFTPTSSVVLQSDQSEIIYTAPIGTMLFYLLTCLKYYL